MASDEVSVRKRISIPKVDESTIEWWGRQKDAGASVRMLIRAEIQRNGIIDVVNAPVTQQPRRGRPPGDAEAPQAPAASAAFVTPDAVATGATGEAESTGQTRVLEVVSARPLPVEPVLVSSEPSIIDSIING